MSSIVGANLSCTAKLCKNCAFVYVQKRFSNTFVKNFKQQEQRKSVVHQYVGLNVEKEIRLYGWGLAKTGALGMKTLLMPKSHQKVRTIQFTPLKIDFFPEKKYKIKNVSCGYGFTLFVCEDTSHNSILLGTGVNTFSQVGFQAGQKFSTEEFDLIYEPGHVFLPLSNPNKTKITHIASGRAHSVVVTDAEGIFTFGNNAFGQCGRGIVEGEIFRNSKVVNHLEFGEKVKQVVCGQDHTLILTEDGRVYSCGLGVDGQTGLGHYNCTERLTLVGGDIKGERIVQISSKSDTVLAVSDKGDLFGWGNTEYDQLECAAPNESQVNMPKHLPFKIGKVKIAAAAGSMCAVLNEEGKIFTWGHGILGRGPKADRSYIPQPLPSSLFGIMGYQNNTEIKDIQCGLHYFMVLTKSGSIYNWGKNGTACLGFGHVKDQFFPWQAQIPAEVMSVHCGVDHAFVICRSFA